MRWLSRLFQSPEARLHSDLREAVRGLPLRELEPGMRLTPFPTLEAGTIAKLDAKAGDVLVVLVKQAMKPEQREWLCTHLGKLVPGVQVLVLDGGLELAVLSRVDLTADQATGRRSQFDR